MLEAEKQSNAAREKLHSSSKYEARSCQINLYAFMYRMKLWRTHDHTYNLPKRKAEFMWYVETLYKKKIQDFCE